MIPITPELIAAVIFPGVAALLGFLVVAIWAERKLVARIQWRYGPLYVSKAIGGFLQPIADLIKLVFSELVIPRHANRLLFAATPVFLFIGEALPVAFVAVAPGLIILYNPYGVLLAVVVWLLAAVLLVAMAWTESDKWTYIGAVREILLTAAYEVPLLLSVLAMIILYGTADPFKVVEAQWLWGALLNPLAFLSFYIALMMSTTRFPFEIPEAEPEVVLGPYTEYGSTLFILSFGGTYVKMYAASLLGVVLFLGGWSPATDTITGAVVTAIKLALFVMPLLIVRAIYPRYRIDQALRLGWSKLLYLSLGAVVLSIALRLWWPF
ncbi:NADH-quinone oxidoreductase subunit NuoH [Pyrobaculum aerophilum]|uniref:NADH-quinone oxidoreductase subunit H n=1 Tax=Pyrobaculum aerophilum TaxID=13773 RepID=A0A371R604_9CREN|nr:NADH-quinone oxidoreductase subunit NuoH [Pyrobaculum aerophilum]RFA97690.1 NADH-quinone oxidoreductase subunit H [Pyrobaculum aerophilum]RFA99502.1 NADH-quinone oxidoreductase subunit H [Pyrobaculum aerophilum]